jgi:AAA family ATP:ADP antiporter
MTPVFVEGEVLPSDLRSRAARFLRGIIPVKRNEIITAVLLTVNVFVLLTCYYILKVVREPLILLGGGAELKAYASAGQTLLLLAVVPAFGMLANRVTRIRLLTVIQLIFIGCLIAFYVLAQAEAPIGLAFYLWLGIFNVLVVSNFWSFANDLYSQEAGKRLFAIIGVGASIGAILGAFMPKLLHEAIGTRQLMLVAAALLGGSIVLYRIVDLRERSRARTAEEKKEPEEAPMGKSGGFALVLKDRYLRLLAAMLLVATIINTSGEYVVGKMASDGSESYAAEKVASAHANTPTPTPDEVKKETKAAQDEYISSFYSGYYTVVNILSLLLQALIVARLLKWLGVRRALFVMPVVVLGGWIAVLALAGITIVRVEKSAENSLDYSLHNTLRQALFLPTSREAKYKGKAAIDTFFFRMGDVVAGLGLVFVLVHVMGLGVRAFAVLNIILAAVWLLLAALSGRLHDKRTAEHAAAKPD